VITDLIMPNEDGIGFLFKIRGETGAFPCKVIVISGGGRIAATQHLDITIAMGVDAALEKPFSREKLLQTIDEVMAN
jgi:CheY-like chemotaxis protein